MKKHADKKGKDCWIIIDGLIYDMNIDSPLKGGHSSGEPKFLTDHPGGKKVLIKQGDIQPYLTLLTGADRLIRSPQVERTPAKCSKNSIPRASSKSMAHLYASAR